jgi:hypothetical protein
MSKICEGFGISRLHSTSNLQLPIQRQKLEDEIWMFGGLFCGTMQGWECLSLLFSFTFQRWFLKLEAALP